MTFDAQAAVQLARHFADIGYHEGPNNSNMFSFWQYRDYNNPWCDSFVCFVAWNAGYRFPAYSACGEKGDFNVGAHHQHAVREGTWRDKNYHASPGDLVVLTFGIPDQHIEVVELDGGAVLSDIGGNTSDACRRRQRSRNDVVGFVALTQSAQNHPPAPPPPPKVKPMYSPALPIAAVLQDNPSSPVHAAVAPDGSVFVWDANLGYHGGANGKPYFAGKQASQIVYPNTVEKNAGKRYTIIATDGARYAYPE